VNVNPGTPGGTTLRTQLAISASCDGCDFNIPPVAPAINRVGSGPTSTPTATRTPTPTGTVRPTGTATPRATPRIPKDEAARQAIQKRLDASNNRARAESLRAQAWDAANKLIIVNSMEPCTAPSARG
jgi:hypothetical protein